MALSKHKSLAGKVLFNNGQCLRGSRQWMKLIVDELFSVAGKLVPWPLLPCAYKISTFDCCCIEWPVPFSVEVTFLLLWQKTRRDKTWRRKYFGARFQPCSLASWHQAQGPEVRQNIVVKLTCMWREGEMGGGRRWRERGERENPSVLSDLLLFISPASSGFYPLWIAT